MAGKGKKDERGGIVVKKEEVVESGHHGGAWKVAYADFVTAMMAFFLLMWLLNATTEEQRRGLADYFSPQNVLARSNSGNGQPFGGRTPYDQENMVSDQGVQSVLPGKQAAPSDDETDVTPAGPPPNETPTPQENPRAGAREDAAGNAPRPQPQDGAHAPGGGVAPRPAQTPSQKEFLANAGAGTLVKPDARQLDEGTLRAELARREQAAFQAAAEQIREAVRSDPQLAELARQLAIDVTPEGLRIQLLDAEHEAMFPSGSAEMNERGQALLRKIAPVLARLPQPIVITGHTDAQPYRGTGRTNWELSSDRAGATRRLLADSGLPEARFREVSGRADREPLVPADPMAAANRRIAILVQSSALPPAAPARAP
jgi:chemotaxis protein MotB